MEWEGRTILGFDMEATGKRIGQIIDASGVSDKRLAEAMGITVQSINKWRHGKNLPDMENCFILAQMLGIKVDDMLVARGPKPEIEIEMEFTEADPASFERRIVAYAKRLARCA